jgi:hypothetical protein
MKFRLITFLYAVVLFMYRHLLSKNYSLYLCHSLILIKYEPHALPLYSRGTFLFSAPHILPFNTDFITSFYITLTHPVCFDHTEITLRYKKLKCTLVQALRLCTGRTAQSGK